ncbi:antibiotic biosynthesis monooxygenase family protein [Proteus mirabilis]|uniref:antibiotic biosynthesis monooxygenase family protein n=1 Tax=Proteus mirabilis TaxID=584 RepID=UPI000F5C752A|nr:antibiotic biosynthesis monooxygenase [Proteus mirabilis]AZG98573.1 antibiotic biosynthesis monooxygenase [Proteus mirabilis]MDM3647084.1 antibiotic biosynthesis monooxygenase [Proteus mirabilis]
MIAVIFEVQIATNKQGQYLSLASQLRPLLNNIDGFISIERFQSLSTEGKLLSLSWWKNEDAILQWKNNILHAKAQQEGKKSIFDFYKIRVHVSQAKITTPEHLRKARTCYNHLAGEIAVKIYQVLCQEEWITKDGTEITEFGDKRFKLMGLNFQAKHSRNICCPCLDWSERRFHLGGQIGSALLNHAQTQGWIKRHQGYREVTINEKGNKAFAQYFNITI